MDPENSFDDLMAKLRAGEDNAATTVFRHFAGRLVALADKRLRAQVRGKEDPEDVVQSVFRSFFQRCQAGEYQIGNWESLWGLLTLITVRKCDNRAKFFHAGRRNVARETPLDEAANLGVGGLLAREPTPLEAAVLAELVTYLITWFQDPGDRAIVELHLQGYTLAEISQQLGRAERTVRRVLARARQQLQQVWDTDPE
jgi:RNA polymerase sigma-70 factor (ECF subfamily)